MIRVWLHCLFHWRHTYVTYRAEDGLSFLCFCATCKPEYLEAFSEK